MSKALEVSSYNSRGALRASFTYGCQDAGGVGKRGCRSVRWGPREGFMALTVQHKADSGGSSESKDEIYFLKGQEPGRMLQGGQESVVPSMDLPSERSGCNRISMSERLDPSVSEVENVDTSRSAVAKDVDLPVGAPAQHFPGFIEMDFSMPNKRYFCEHNRPTRMGSGTFAIINKVFWYNQSTGDLELCVAKALRVELAATHSGGMVGWKADAFHEVEPLRYVAGVPGVVRFRDIIEGANNAIHIIMERVDGLHLSKRISYRGSTRFGLTWLQIRSALIQLAQILAECHKRGLVHGDLKPNNIMSLPDKSGIVLIDFGTASMWNGRGWECRGGTISYTAPESFRTATWNDGDAHARFPIYGPPADCWAFGLTAFNLLTGSSLYKTSEDESSTDEGSGADVSWDVRHARRIVKLQEEWAHETESSPIHASFREKVQQLARASEDFQREGIDFLRGFLHPDPAQRLTAEKALQHPFLTNAFDSVSTDSMPPEGEEDFALDTTFRRQLWDKCGALIKKYGL